MIEYTVKVWDNGNKSWYLNDKLSPRRWSC